VKHKDVNVMKRKPAKNGLEAYKTTLILLSILLAVMSLILMMPLKPDKHPVNSNNITAPK